MDVNTIIVDNFLERPDLVRKSALALNFYERGEFPGLRSDRADEGYEQYIKEKLEQILNKKIKSFLLDSFRFQICTENETTWIHKDPTEYAAVLYLTPNAPVQSGTGIYSGEEGNWVLVTAMGNVYNRLVIYKGNLYHQSMMSGFGNSVDTGRLTQVFFFEVE